MLSKDKFREEFLSKLHKEYISNSSNGLEKFLQICLDVLDKFSPKKKNCNRGNDMPFTNKPYVRARMKRSRNRLLEKQV